MALKGTAHRALNRSLLVFVAIMAMLSSVMTSTALADGTEILGPPTVPLADGSGFAIGGIGLVDGQPASFTVDVPVGASVEQVLLYWEGFDNRTTDSGDSDTVMINGAAVTGPRIGGPTVFFRRAVSSTYRADITSLGLVSDGSSTLTIEGLSFTNVNNGAGVLVVYDDGSEADLQLVDGQDLAFFNFASPLDTTVPQTFDFDPVPFDRDVDLSMFASSVDGDSANPRPNAVLVTIDGATTVFDTPFQNNDGNEWDAVTLTVTVPAGADSMTIQAISADVDMSGDFPASFAWIGLGVAIPLPDEPMPGIDIEKLTNGNQADGANDADVPEIAPGATVTWTYVVTNTGDVAFAAADVVVVDDIPGVTPVFDPASDDGDNVLSPGEVWTYTASGTADDLESPSAGTVVVQGCNPDGPSVPGERATYQNFGTVTVPGDSDSDPSHYCNPPVSGIHLEKLTNGNQADGANDADVPEIASGDVVTWTYVVTNTGDTPYALADVDVSDDIPGVTPVFDPASDVGSDDVLSPGEVWTYTASGTAEDLDAPSAGTVVVDGCNPDGTSVPGDRATYENIGTVTVPGASDTDPSHYCNPPDPGIDIEKLTNGNQADGANDADVPEIASGDVVTWTYVVTNTGDVAFAEADVDVTDDIIGAVTVIVDQGDGDSVLSPGEVWTYEATAADGADDLENPSAGTVVVQGCNPDGTTVPGDRATYENIGAVTVPGDSDSDPSHYCNPPMPGIDIEKLTNGNQADGANDIDVPEIAPGDAVTWTYIVTNTGDVPYALADVNVTDDMPGVTPVFDPASDDGDNVLSPGEVWTYEATAAGGAEDLENPTPGTAIVSGCNPDGTTVPGDRATYENIGTVEVPGATDSDPSHYCNPPVEPAIALEKFTLVIPAGGSGADLCDAFDKPAELTMVYTGDGPEATSNSQDAGKVVVTGDPNDASPVLIVASKDPDGGGDAYFTGVVDLGGEFVIDAGLVGDDNFPSSIHVTIYDSSGNNILQEIEFHTSCSQPLFLGDQFGAAQLVGFVDKNGAGDTLPPPADEYGEDADTPTGPIANAGDTIQWTYFVTNPGDLSLTDVVVTDDNGTAGDTSDDFTATPLVEGGNNVGDDNDNGLLDPGEEWLFQAIGVAKLGQYANIGTVVGQPLLGNGDTFGDPVSDVDPSHYFGVFAGDLCDAFDKPAELTMVYTGDGPEATSNSQDAGKVVVTGDPNDASPVLIVASKDPDGGGDVYFTGVVDLGGEFVIDAGLVGDDNFPSSIHVTIYDSSGNNILQEIEFHTSCSQPLFIGDQFGGIQLVDFIDKNGEGPGTVPGDGGVVILDKVEFKGKELKIKLDNTGSVDLVLTSVDVSWPTTPNGGLVEIKNGGDSIYKPGSAQLISPLLVDGADWTASSKKRTLKDGDTREFKFKFQNDVLKDLTSYEVTFTFDDGTTITVGG